MSRILPIDIKIDADDAPDMEQGNQQKVDDEFKIPVGLVLQLYQC